MPFTRNKKTAEAVYFIQIQKYLERTFLWVQDPEYSLGCEHAQATLYGHVQLLDKVFGITNARCN